MGETFYVVNASKQQFFDPDDFGENTKRSGLLYGVGGFALGRLLLGELEGEYWLESWAGDSLYVVGDYPPVSSFPFLSGIDDPQQSTWLAIRQHYDDITLNLIAFLIKNEHSVRDHLFQRAERDGYLFATLVQAFEHLASPSAQQLIERFGTNWRKRHGEAMKQVHGSLPIPMTPQTRKNGR